MCFYAGMDTGAVSRRLKALGVSPANQWMADYWLSRCRAGVPPLYSSLDLCELSDVLRYCSLIEVTPGKSLRIRIAGMALRLVLGDDVAGKDFLALTPAPQRAQRLTRYSAVATGAIGVGRRKVLRPDGGMAPIESVILPLADVGPADLHLVLVHTDWRPEGQEWLGVDATYVLTLVDEFHLVPLD